MTRTPGSTGGQPRKLIGAAAWSCLAFIGYATLTSIEDRPELIGAGFYPALITVLERFGAYATLGLLFSIAYHRHRRLVYLIVFGSAIILELTQMIVPDRHAGFLDALEKLAGGAVGIIIARASERWLGSDTRF